MWAANGSNEVMQQILQAFGGPGRTALSFAPTYSMYPEYARNTHTRWVAGRRREDFAIDVDRRRRADRGRAARRRLPDLAQQPHRHGARRSRTLRAVLEVAPGVVVVDEAYAEFRRDGHAQRARAARRVTRA